MVVRSPAAWGSATPWRSAPVPRAWPRLIQEYAKYRQVHRGAARSTIVRDCEVACDLLRKLRSNGCETGDVGVSDIDALVAEWSGRLARRTVAGRCSSLRCFLRFLQTTGRVRRDAASTIVAPRYRVDERPPRALPWHTVRRLLRVIPRDRGVGRRDYAMFLLMATYGLGGGEVVRLRLDDVDWRRGVLRARRPKTEVPIELPLLSPVARVVAAYLRRGRPPAPSVREIFLTACMPHRPLTTSVLRHQARKYATRAGIRVAVLGAHAFRHSYATRQVDAGVSLKVVGDILGHRRPSSTSLYVRLALRRLRGVGLPVPR
jgi:site-specific recombinase XerD